MSSVTVRDLDLEAFQVYGSFVNMINPTAFCPGKPPVQFFRDMIQQDLGPGTGSVSYAICRVEERPLAITGGEYHNRTCEGILPIDNDILIHVAPGTHPRMGFPPAELFEVYRVPKGTMVILRPGVWHGAPWSANAQPANVLVALPERTYANDSASIRLEESQYIKIVGA